MTQAEAVVANVSDTSESPSPESQKATETICPATCREPSSWPTPLHDFVRTLGVDVVWQKGLDVLEYPPTWAGDAREFKKMYDALSVPVKVWEPKGK